MLTQSRLKEILKYNPDTGDFVRIESPRDRHNGEPTGETLSTGYVRIFLKIDGVRKRYYAHRLAFLYMEGMMPDNDVIIDHIDLNPSNNRWENLRKSTRSLNAANSLKVAGYFGVRGVYQTKEGNWQARLQVNGQRIHLGTFSSIEEAEKAYDTARQIHYGDVIPARTLAQR